MAITQAEIEAAAKAICHRGLEKCPEARFNSCSCLSKAKAALEAAERARWQPIETLQKTDQPLIFAWTDGKISMGFWDTQFLKLEKPSRWQFAPSPPESK